jgi:hypothetical protein
MKVIADTNQPVPVSGYQIELLDGEMVLFHPTKVTLLHCNQSGAMIWQLCNGQRTVAEIIQLLKAIYPEAAQEIGVDVKTTLQSFAQHGAITWA